MVVKKLAKKIIKKAGIRKKLASKGKIRADRLNRKKTIKVKKLDKKINRVKRILIADKAPGATREERFSKSVKWTQARKDAGYVGPRSKASKAPWMKDRKDLMNYLDKAEKTAPGGGPPPWVKYKEVKRGERMIDGITFRQTLDDVLTPQEMGKYNVPKRIDTNYGNPIPSIKPSTTTNFISSSWRRSSRYRLVCL